MRVRHYNLGKVEIDNRAVHHYQIAAMMGRVNARNNLGYVDVGNGNYHHAMKHFMIAAKWGFRVSLNNV
eukprot:scaffold11800_cov27-Cyclotella_meneghiniana.AAC.3